jgi:hypothetical protein
MKSEAQTQMDGLIEQLKMYVDGSHSHLHLLLAKLHTLLSKFLL